MSNQGGNPPRVFISYRHDSEDHVDRVLELSDLLRSEGIDASIDFYESSPSQGWARWSLDELEAARFVLVVATKGYYDAFRGRDGVGGNAAWQGFVLTSELFSKGDLSRFVPIVFGDPDREWVPEPLRSATIFDLSSSGDYEDLYRLLTAQPKILKPDLGKRVSLPPRPSAQPGFGRRPEPRPGTAEIELPRDVHRREVTAKIEAAEDRRTQILRMGEDTTEIASEILDLRRLLRSGPQLSAGETLGAGRYLLVRQIGQGGFATVWEAYDETYQDRVALKVLHGQYGVDSERLERFERGARRMKELRHRHIVRVLEDPISEEGWTFFPMKLVRGGDLRKAVLNGRVSPDQILRILEQVASALDHAHARGMIHRDVKPANILLTEDLEPKLTDFDLVRALDSTGGTRTAAGLGTYLYAAPESMSDAANVRPACDVYSLAAVAVFLFKGEELDLLFVHDRPAYLAGLNLSDSARGVLKRSLSLRPEDRPRSSKAFVDELRRVLHSSPESPPKPQHSQAPPKVSPPPRPAPKPPPPRVKTSQRRKRKPARPKLPWWKRVPPAVTYLIGVPLLAFVISMAVVIWVEIQNRNTPSPEQPIENPVSSDDSEGRTAEPESLEGGASDGDSKEKEAEEPSSTPEVTDKTFVEDVDSKDRFMHDPEPDLVARSRSKRESTPSTGFDEQESSPEGNPDRESGDQQEQSEDSVDPPEPEPGELKTVGGMRFRYVPAGTFWMGSPEDEEGRYERETRHQVTLTQGFWMGETEVTQAQWQDVMGSNPSYFKNCGGECPVESVSWYDAVLFANKLSQKADLEPCYLLEGESGTAFGEDLKFEKVSLKEACEGFRLPTEAEWERAARAGTSTAVYNTEVDWKIVGERNAPALDAIAWYGGNSGATYAGGYDCSGWTEKQNPDLKTCGPQPVRGKDPNDWQLYNMLGNVWEWVWDGYSGYSSGSVLDPKISEGSGRVLRGGSWFGQARGVRAAYRLWDGPGNRGSGLGFRLSRGPEPGPEAGQERDDAATTEEAERTEGRR